MMLPTETREQLVARVRALESGLRHLADKAGSDRLQPFEMLEVLTEADVASTLLVEAGPVPSPEDVARHKKAEAPSPFRLALAEERAVRCPTCGAAAGRACTERSRKHRNQGVSITVLVRSHTCRVGAALRKLKKAS